MWQLRITRGKGSRSEKHFWIGKEDPVPDVLKSFGMLFSSFDRGCKSPYGAAIWPQLDGLCSCCLSANPIASALAWTSSPPGRSQGQAEVIANLSGVNEMVLTTSSLVSFYRCITTHIREVSTLFLKFAFSPNCMQIKLLVLTTTGIKISRTAKILS